MMGLLKILTMGSTETYNKVRHPLFILYPDFSLKGDVKSGRMSDQKVTVLVYHYVRDLENNRYPAIRGLDLELFKSQIDYLAENYTFITIKELIQAIEEKAPLPPKAVLLTFNDCYADHFNNVFPLLDERGIQGCFYPEIAAIEEPKVLINHKIHFILASAENTTQIKNYIFSALDNLREQYNLKSNEYYFHKLAKPSEYDSKETIFVKRLLQTELPGEVSRQIADQLFDHFVEVDEKVFSRELYLDKKQVKCMIHNGMHFGILGYHHRRYDNLDKEEQRKEITHARDYLVDIGVDDTTLTASYPWGAYNQDTLEVLEEMNCKAAFTSHPDIANLASHSRLELPRLDTNEVPKHRDAEPDHWYAEA